MVIRGRLADMLIQIAPDVYKKYDKKDRNGNTAIYVRLNKALYGLMEAPIIFYERLLKDLERKGFKINP